MIDIKSQIAPKGLEFKSNEFIISDKYACILTNKSKFIAVILDKNGMVKELSDINIIDNYYHYH